MSKEDTRSTPQYPTITHNGCEAEQWLNEHSCVEVED